MMSLAALPIVIGIAFHVNALDTYVSTFALFVSTNAFIIKTTFSAALVLFWWRKLPSAFWTFLKQLVDHPGIRTPGPERIPNVLAHVRRLVIYQLLSIPLPPATESKVSTEPIGSTGATLGFYDRSLCPRASSRGFAAAINVATTEQQLLLSIS